MRCLVYVAVLLTAAVVVPAAAAERRGEPKNEPPFVALRAADIPVVPPPAPPVPPPPLAPAPAAPTTQSATAATVAVTPEPQRLRAGVNFECNNIQEPARGEVMSRIANANVEWVRTQVWIELLNDPSYLPGLDACLAMGRANGQKLLVIVNTFSRVIDPARYTAALTLLATRYRGLVGAWEILNEPNQQYTYGLPLLTASEYVAILRASYTAAKAVDPSTPILTAGMLWAEPSWLRDVYRAGGRPYFDAVSVHPYAQGYAPEEGYHIFGLPEIPALRQEMVAQGDGAKPIWATELGWHLPCCDLPAGWPSVPSQAVQADYLRRSLVYTRDQLPYVTHWFWYTAYSASGHDWFDALLGPNYEPTLAWGALRAWTG